MVKGRVSERVIFKLKPGYEKEGGIKIMKIYKLSIGNRNMQKHGHSSKLITLILLLADTNYSFPWTCYKKASEQKKKCNQKAKKKKSTLFASLAVTGVYYHPSSPTDLQERFIGQPLTCLNDLIHRPDFLL